MSISSYVAGLLPSYEAATLKDNLHSNVKELSEHILPAYESVIELFNEVPMKDAEIIELSKDFTEKLERTGLKHKDLKDATIVEYVREVARNIISIEGYLKERIDADCGRVVISDGITFNRQMLIQLLESVDFFNRYAKTLVNYITYRELSLVEESRQRGMGIGPDDKEYLETKLFAFTMVCRILGTPLSKLRADYNETPMMAVDPANIGELQAVFGDRIDPMRFSDVPFPLSLFLHGGMTIANYQMDQYDDTVATAKAVELRVLLYKKKVATGEGDAAQEKLLDLQEKRLMELRRKQERLEKKYGLK